jgi:hypothetical protein
VEEEEESSSHGTNYDSSDDGDSLLAESIIISRSASVRRRMPMHYTWRFSFDRDSVFEDGEISNVAGGIRDGLVEAYHNYVSLWLAMREAELRAMSFEGYWPQTRTLSPEYDFVFDIDELRISGVCFKATKGGFHRFEGTIKARLPLKTLLTAMQAGIQKVRVWLEYSEIHLRSQIIDP